jgi:hypothetical protein
MTRNCKTILAVLVFAAAVSAAPALAQTQRQATTPTCVNNYPQRSLIETIFSTGPAPQANGCAPAVYSGGRFVGQDPDPNIRLQLRRDSDNEGYHLNTR